MAYTYEQILKKKKTNTNHSTSLRAKTGQTLPNSLVMRVMENSRAEQEAIEQSRTRGYIPGFCFVTFDSIHSD